MPIHYARCLQEFSDDRQEARRAMLSHLQQAQACERPSGPERVYEGIDEDQGALLRSRKGVARDEPTKWTQIFRIIILAVDERLILSYLEFAKSVTLCDHTNLDRSRLYRGQLACE